MKEKEVDELVEVIRLYFSKGDNVYAMKEIIFEFALFFLERAIESKDRETIGSNTFFLAQILKAIDGYNFVNDEDEGGKRLKACFEKMMENLCDVKFYAPAILNICEETAYDIYIFEFLLRLSGHDNSCIAERARKIAKDYCADANLLIEMSEFLPILAKWAVMETEREGGKVSASKKISVEILHGYFSSLTKEDISNHFSTTSETVETTSTEKALAEPQV